MKTKIAFLISTVVALNGCSTIDTVKNLGSPDKNKVLELETMDDMPFGLERREFELAEQLNKVLDCDIEVTSTKMWAESEAKVCTLNVISQVNDVKVNQYTGTFSSGKVLWEKSELDSKQITLDNCDDLDLILNKKYYNKRECSAVFEQGDTATLVLSPKDWIKYGYVRMDYVEGESHSIAIEGLPKKEVLKKNESFVQKVELGDYEVSLVAPYMAKSKIGVSVSLENDIDLITLKTKGDNQYKYQEPAEHTLVQGKSLLLVTTEQDGVSFTIGGDGIKDIEYKAPQWLELPSGDYTFTYNGVSRSIKLERNKEQKIELDTGIKIAKVNHNSANEQ